MTLSDFRGVLKGQAPPALVSRTIALRAYSHHVRGWTPWGRHAVRKPKACLGAPSDSVSKSGARYLRRQASR